MTDLTPLDPDLFLPHDGDPMDRPLNHPLLGRRVTVTIARAGEPGAVRPRHRTVDITHTGVLLRVTVSGDFDLRLDDGQTLYGWPCLDVTEAPTEPGCAS